MQVNTVRHYLSNYWVGAAAISNQGFTLPTCAPQTEAFPLYFVPCPELDHVCRGRAYRIRSGQSGLDDADLFYNARDIAIPSIIYRDRSPNNPLGYVFDLIPVQGDVFALRSLGNGHYVGRDCSRLVTRPQLTQDSWFRLFAF